MCILHVMVLNVLLGGYILFRSNKVKVGQLTQRLLRFWTYVQLKAVKCENTITGEFREQHG